MSTQISKSAGAYLVQDQVIFHSNRTSETGLLIACEPIFSISNDAPDEDIGKLLQKAFDPVEEPDRGSSGPSHAIELIVEMAGVKSFLELQRVSKYCGLELSNRGISVIPTHNGGTAGDSKGFQYLPDEEILISPKETIGSIGEALKTAFSRCTSSF